MRKLSISSIFTRFIIAIIAVTFIMPSAFAFIGLHFTLSAIRTEFAASIRSCEKSVLGYFSEQDQNLKSAAKILAAASFGVAQETGSARGLIKEIVRVYDIDQAYILDPRGDIQFQNSSDKLPPSIIKSLRKTHKLPRSVRYWSQDTLVFGVFDQIKINGKITGFAFTGKNLQKPELKALESKLGARLVIKENGRFLATVAQGLAEKVDARYHAAANPNQPREIEYAGRGYSLSEPPLQLDQNSSNTIFWVIADTQKRAQKEMNAISWIGASLIFIIGIGLLFVAIFSRTMRRQLFRPLENLSALTGRMVDADSSSGPFELSKNKEMRAIEANVFALMDRFKNLKRSWNKKVSEINVMHEMSDLACRTSDIWELANILVDNALKASGADVVHLILLNSKSQEMELQVIKTIEGKEKISTTALIENGLVETVNSRRQPVIFRVPWSNKTDETPLSVESAICLPLTFGDKLEGVLFVGAANADRNYSGDDINLLMSLANGGAAAIENAKIFEIHQNIYIETVRALSTAIDAKDPFTYGHSERVARIVTAMAKKMGWSGQALNGLETAAYLHDIGKLGISNEILLKAGKLSSDEMAIIRRHPTIGSSILTQVTFPWDIIPYIRHHHEQFDGSGYPAGLAGKDIPEGSRILAVADVFETLTANRPYREVLPFEEAVDEIVNCSGTQFDPEVVAAFNEVIKPSMIDFDRLRDTRVGHISKSDEALGLRTAYISLGEGLMQHYVESCGHDANQEITDELNRYFAYRGWDVSANGQRIIFGINENRCIEDQTDFYIEALKLQILMMVENLNVDSLHRLCNSIIDSMGSPLVELVAKYGLDKVCGIVLERYEQAERT